MSIMCQILLCRVVKIRVYASLRAPKYCQACERNEKKRKPYFYCLYSFFAWNSLLHSSFRSAVELFRFFLNVPLWHDIISGKVMADITSKQFCPLGFQRDPITTNQLAALPRHLFNKIESWIKMSRRKWEQWQSPIIAPPDCTATVNSHFLLHDFIAGSVPFDRTFVFYMLVAITFQIHQLE